MGDVRPIRTAEDLAREHFFYFPAKPDAERAAGRLRDRGWATHVALGADPPQQAKTRLAGDTDVNWLLFAQEPAPVGDMEELWDELTRLAEEFNGWYDGYGSLA